MHLSALSAYRATRIELRIYAPLQENRVIDTTQPGRRGPCDRPQQEPNQLCKDNLVSSLLSRGNTANSM
eukprot:10303944-Alexandrium_andersonii.AAC.1